MAQIKYFTYKLAGLEKFDKMMVKMGRAFTKREQLSALRYAVRPVEKQMKENIPHNRTGNLWLSIATSEDPAAERMVTVGGFRAVEVGVITGSRRGGGYGKKGYHSHLLEWGVKPHTITAGEGKMIPIKGGFAKTVQHPGISGKKVFSKAINQQINQVENRLMDKYQKILLKSMKA